MTKYDIYERIFIGIFIGIISIFLEDYDENNERDNRNYYNI